MYDTYHSALYELPWVLFIPDLNALDEMIKVTSLPLFISHCYNLQYFFMFLKKIYIYQDYLII